MSSNERSSAGDETIDLASIRHELDLTQSELAVLLAVSLRTVQSCEQGWRKPGTALEKAALLLLIAARNGPESTGRACWETLDCPQHLRQGCLAYSSHQGHLCWFLTGTLCQGKRQGSWRKKFSQCRNCSFFTLLLRGKLPLRRL